MPDFLGKLRGINTQQMHGGVESFRARHFENDRILHLCRRRAYCEPGVLRNLFFQLPGPHARIAKVITYFFWSRATPPPLTKLTPPAHPVAPPPRAEGCPIP